MVTYINSFNFHSSPLSKVLSLSLFYKRKLGQNEFKKLAPNHRAGEGKSPNSNLGSLASEYGPIVFSLFLLGS